MAAMTWPRPSALAIPGGRGRSTARSPTAGPRSARWCPRSTRATSAPATPAAPRPGPRPSAGRRRHRPTRPPARLQRVPGAPGRAALVLGDAQPRRDRPVDAVGDVRGCSNRRAVLTGRCAASAFLGRLTNPAMRRPRALLPGLHRSGSGRPCRFARSIHRRSVALTRCRCRYPGRTRARAR
jgi:hypothetical protein